MCANLVATKQLLGSIDRIACPSCLSEPKKGGPPLFKDFNPTQKNEVKQHYWDKTPSCSLALGKGAVVQLEPARTLKASIIQSNDMKEKESI